MVRIARLAVAEQSRTVARTLQQRKACRFAEADALAGRVERPTWLRRHQLQRIEAEEHAVAERVDTTDNSGVCKAEPHQSLGLRENFGAR